MISPKHNFALCNELILDMKAQGHLEEVGQMLKLARATCYSEKVAIFLEKLARRAPIIFSEIEPLCY